LDKVSLRLFGVPRLDVDSGPIQLGRRKAMALLSYLAVTRNRHHRETLAALLWPESGPDAAYAALRNVLWILRQTPLGDLLRTDRNTAELVEDLSVVVDVNRFRDLTATCPAGSHPRTEACNDCAPALEQAVSLFAAPFMEGFVLSNADGFDDWQFAEREALQRELSETLDRLTAFHTGAGDWIAVTTYARRWLEIDALNEPCVRRLMSALVALGRRSEAIHCFEQCARLLDKELSVQPEAATMQLVDRIKHATGTSGLRSEPTRATNLPIALGPFVGRSDIMDQTIALWTKGDARLVSLIGLSGIGKTSLAIEIGRRLQDRMEHGVFSVPLGAIDGKEDAISAIAHGLGLSPSRRTETDTALELTDYLREREILLILDEVERIPTIGLLVTSLLSAAPRALCLVTSTAPLHVGGEAIVALHGLDAPPEGTSAEHLGGYDAIRLLKVAERQVESSPAEQDEELLAMARVARLLEGFPLGLEMAGAWRSVFSWREIADRISSSLDFLVHTHRDVPPRHRNLRAVYEQAWNLLSREERETLCRLAVFRGGFTIDDAERTTGGSTAAFASLAERCLIRRVAPERYQVHELLRQFSLGNLRETESELESAVEHHTIYYIRLVAESFEQLKGPKQLETLKRLQSDLLNIRTAWLHAAREGRAELLQQAEGGLFFYFDMQAHFEEGARVFYDAIQQLGVDSDAAVAGFLRVAYGWFARFTAEAEPVQWIDEGLQLLDSVEPFSCTHALANIIASYARTLPDIDEIRNRLRRSLAFFRDAHDMWGEALATDCLAGAEFRTDTEKGEQLAEESLRLRKGIGDHWGEALNLATLARFAEVQGKWDLAKVRYHQSQRLSIRIADDLYMAIDAQLSRARIAGYQGEYDEARELAADGLMLAQRASNRPLIAQALIELGRIAREEGEVELARTQLEEAFSLLEGTPWREAAGHCAALLAKVAEDAGDESKARTWLQEARILESEGMGA